MATVITGLGSRAIQPPPTDASKEVRSFANALATGDIRLLGSLLHEKIEHRDLASGAAIHGRHAWEAFFRKAYPTPTPNVSSTAKVLSSRLLTHEVAIANITLQPLVESTHASSWPPHTAVIFVFDQGRWFIRATRAGGNYETLAHGQLID